MENSKNISSKSLFDHIKREIKEVYTAEEASVIAFVLLEAYFTLEKTAILASKDLSLTEDKCRQLTQALTRLKNHEPVQYVLGEAPFLGRMFKVSPFVLIPRPETEELVDEVIKKCGSKEGLKIIDIATGSGCIAVSLALELKNAEVWATDINIDCLQTARKNAEGHRTFVHFLQTDALDSKEDERYPNQFFDVMVSNPPYIPESEGAYMDKNVVEYEPSQALFVPDNDPLIFYKALLRIADVCLKTGGDLFAEIHEKLEIETIQLFLSAERFERVSVKKDINGKPRVLMARGLKH